MKEAYTIYMSFHKMVFYLKDAHIMIWCYHVPSGIFIYSVMKNDKVNNWSQEIHAITPYIKFKHIKGKENILADSLSQICTLGVCKANEAKKGHEYGKSESEAVCSTKNSQKVNQTFEVDRVKYQPEEKHVDDLLYHNTLVNLKHHDPPQCKLT